MIEMSPAEVLTATMKELQDAFRYMDRSLDANDLIGRESAEHIENLGEIIQRLQGELQMFGLIQGGSNVGSDS